MDFPNAVPKDWETLDQISELLTWVSHYDSRAILRLADGKGLLLLVAFLSTSSLNIRCKGFQALLNLRYLNYSPEGRFCDPEYVECGRTPTLELFFKMVDASVVKPLVEIKSSVPNVDERYHNPGTRQTPAQAPFDALGAALRFVQFELEGPQTIEESFHYPKLRVYGTEKVTEAHFEDMEIALDYHKKYYERDVFRLGLYMMSLRDESLLPDEKGFSAMHISASMEATKDMERWPDRCYFHYARIKLHIGAIAIKWVTAATECSDCTPHLRRLLQFEHAVSVLCLLVTHLSHSPISSNWAADYYGNDNLDQAEEHILETRETLEAGSAESQLLALLSLLTEMLNKGPELGHQATEELVNLFLLLRLAELTILLA